MQEDFGDTKGVMAKGKRVNNDLQNITQNTRDRATRTLLKTEDELRSSGRVSSSCSSCYYSYKPGRQS